MDQRTKQKDILAAIIKQKRLQRQAGRKAVATVEKLAAGVDVPPPAEDETGASASGVGLDPLPVLPPVDVTAIIGETATETGMCQQQIKTLLEIKALLEMYTTLRMRAVRDEEARQRVEGVAKRDIEEIAKLMQAGISDLKVSLEYLNNAIAPLLDKFSAYFAMAFNIAPPPEATGDEEEKEEGAGEGDDITVEPADESNKENVPPVVDKSFTGSASGSASGSGGEAVVVNVSEGQGSAFKPRRSTRT